MIDPAQTALFIVIIVLTVLLVVLGIQVFFILRELRKTITKVNKVLVSQLPLFQHLPWDLKPAPQLQSSFKQIESIKKMNDSKFSTGLLIGLIIGAGAVFLMGTKTGRNLVKVISCILYTSDAADE